MSDWPNPKEMDRIVVGSHSLKCIVYQVYPFEQECDVLYIWQGEKLRELVKWDDGHWQFKGGAGSADGLLYQSFFDALEGKIHKPRGEKGGRRSYRRSRSR